jgi:hypothetical protein
VSLQGVGGLGMPCTAQPQPSHSTLASNELILARCERVVIAWLEGPLKAANGLVEPSLKN